MASILFLHLLIVHDHECINIHRPVLIMADIHDDIAEAAEFSSAHKLGEEITDHLVCWIVVNGDVLALGHVPDKEIVDVHVAGVSADGHPSIQLQQLCACAVLVELGQLAFPFKISCMLPYGSSYWGALQTLHQ